jgi:hypothetical protein
VLLLRPPASPLQLLPSDHLTYVLDDEISWNEEMNKLLDGNFLIKHAHMQRCAGLRILKTSGLRPK